MIIRPVTPDERLRFNAAASHPLQSWEWGEFRARNGQQVERLGVFDDHGQLLHALQVTFHHIPVLGGTAGYVPKGPLPTAEILGALKDLGKRHGSVFIKLEPDSLLPVTQSEAFAPEKKLLEENDAKLGRTLFTPYTFVLDLTPTEEELMANLKSKTRYNLRLAEKKGVQIVENTSAEGLEEYLRLLRETTERQGFYAHNEEYFRTMWEVMKESGMIRILHAKFEGKVLSSWILFLFNGTGYYPYGASSREHRDVMANNLLMWEALKLAKREGCTTFDMWGALGPDPDPKHKWYGFHKFKEGYNAMLMQSLPTHDLVVNGPIYSIFTLADAARWSILRLRKQIGL